MGTGEDGREALLEEVRVLRARTEELERSLRFVRQAWDGAPGSPRLAGDDIALAPCPGAEASPPCRQLIEEFRRLRSIVESSPMVVFLRPYDTTLPPQYVSANVQQFGYTASQLTSGEVSWWGIVCAEDVPRLQREEASFVARQLTEYEQRYRILTVQGEERWIEDWNIVLRDSAGVATHVQGLLLDVTGRHRVEDSLLSTYGALHDKSQQLTQANAALQEALRLVELQRERITTELMANLHGLLLPMVGHLKAVTNGVDRRYVELVEESLRTLTEPFVGTLESRRYDLTPAELQICYLIRGGLATKEIASSLSIATETVRTHRRNIRRKLGLSGTPQNLALFLRHL